MDRPDPPGAVPLIVPRYDPSMPPENASPSASRPDRFEQLRAAILQFSSERDWGQFHDPKNLAMAIGVEVGELMDHFRWVGNGASPELLKDPRTRDGVEDEAADVLILLMEFAAVCGIDLLDAAERKLARNADRYPVALSRGRAEKHDRGGGGGAGDMGAIESARASRAEVDASRPASSGG